jgi:hypothetical protein
MRHGERAEDAVYNVMPSTLGFGFSGKPKGTGSVPMGSRAYGRSQ